MSDDIRIQFDREPVFRSGEPVSGVIVIDDFDGRRIEEVVIRAAWLAVGEGYEYEGHHGTLVVQEGPLVGTGEHRIPFRFEAPLEPMSYRGHLFQIGHALEARARVSGGADLVAVRTFALTPGVSVAPPAEPEPEGKLPAGRRQSAGARAAVGVALVVAGIATLPVPGGLLLLGGLLFLSAGLRRAVARGRIGEVVMLVHPRVLGPGDELRVAAAVGPPRNVKIDRVTATLRATEVVSRGSSSDRKTERHEVFAEQVELAGARQLDKGKEVLFETLLQIPDRDIWSFRTANGAVEWEVVLEVAVASWPDWVASSPLVVRPAAQPAIASGAVERRADEAGASSSPAKTPEPPPATGVSAVAPAARSTARPQAGSVATPPRPEPKPAARSAPAKRSQPDSAPRPKSARAKRTAQEPTPRPKPTPRPEPAPRAKPAPRPRPTPSAAGTPIDKDVPPFDAAVAEVMAAGVVTGNRRALAARLVGRPVTCSVVIGRVERPFGRRLPSPWKEGRVVQARLRHSGHEVEVLVPAAAAAEVDHLSRGGTLEVDGVVTEWARLPDRPVIRQRA